MNCDLILTENSCRFCLGYAENGTKVFCDKKTYFCVEKRLVDSNKVLQFLNLKIHDEISLPNVPNRICSDCRNTIISFYALKKNFQDNEAVLLGKSESAYECKPDPVKVELLKRVKEFLDEHEGEPLNITKYTDKLVLHPRIIRPNGSDPKQLKVVSYQQSAMSHIEQTANFHRDDNSNDSSNFVEEQQTVESPEHSADYLVGEYTDDNKPFICQFCDRAFLSRSGRDTHQQLKHRVPEDFVDQKELDSHELELELQTGELIKGWKCPFCSFISRRKNHHQTHLMRHAIRDKFTFKQEKPVEDPCVTITQTGSIYDEDSQKLVPKVEITEPKDENVTRDHPSPASNVPVVREKVSRDYKCFIEDDGICFTCSGCRSQFSDVKLAVSHVQRLGKNGFCTSVACVECCVAFPTEKLYQRHRGYHSLAPIAKFLNYFECKTCKVIFSTKIELDHHLDLHKEFSDSYQYQPESTALFEGYELLVKDLSAKPHPNDFRCGSCRKFGSRNEINLHISIFHAILVCPFDNQNFSRGVGYFVDHMKTKHPEKFGTTGVSFACPHCSEEFPYKASMLEHCSVCQAKSFSCHHCEKKYVNERQLKQHLALVRGIKNHKCIICSKFFANVSDLKLHGRSHTNDRPYRCTFPGCQKKFRVNSHLSAHMDTHNTHKNYKCPSCNKMFQTRGARRIHQRTHAAVLSKCEICHKTFKQRSHYVRHVNDIHHITCRSYNLEEAIHNSTKLCVIKEHSSIDDQICDVTM